MRRCLVILAATVALVGYAQTNAPVMQVTSTAPQPGSGSLQGFTVPEYDANGQLIWQMFGDSARVELVGGRVEVQGMRLEFYQKGSLDATMRSPVCLFDRGSKTASSDEAVEIVATNMMVTGKGFDWNSNDSRMRIRSDATMTIFNRKGMPFPKVGVK
ncbi:MAG: hypothetical protein HZC54_13900 [Verrucomicrobia bacterium]|nr:hypothetical protein [Verrucomicrobiota bacterium]